MTEKDEEILDKYDLEFSWERNPDSEYYDSEFEYGIKSKNNDDRILFRNNIRQIMRNSNEDFDFYNYLIKNISLDDVELSVVSDSKGNKNWNKYGNGKGHIDYSQKEILDNDPNASISTMSKNQFNTLQPYAKEKEEIKKIGEKKRKAQKQLDKQNAKINDIMSRVKNKG